MADEKDRFGDKLRDVERAREDTYFAERDRALLEKARAASTAEQETAVRELAHMRCPKCGTPLVSRRHVEVTLDECPSCEGMWLDKGELEQLAGRETSSWLSRYLGRARR